MKAGDCVRRTAPLQVRGHEVIPVGAEGVIRHVSGTFVHALFGDKSYGMDANYLEVVPSKPFLIPLDIDGELAVIGARVIRQIGEFGIILKDGTNKRVASGMTGVILPRLAGMERNAVRIRWDEFPSSSPDEGSSAIARKQSYLPDPVEYELEPEQIAKPPRGLWLDGKKLRASMPGLLPQLTTVHKPWKNWKTKSNA